MSLRSLDHITWVNAVTTHAASRMPLPKDFPSLRNEWEGHVQTAKAKGQLRNGADPPSLHACPSGDRSRKHSHEATCLKRLELVQLSAQAHGVGKDVMPDLSWTLTTSPSFF